jgi:hypothetical protein
MNKRGIDIELGKGVDVRQEDEYIIIKEIKQLKTK